MSFRVHREGELEYLTSDVLDGAAHCFSTRFGGVSEGALASLNLGTHRGDRPENVLENYARLGRAVGFAPEETVFTKQVHSAIVERVGRADCGRGLQREAEHGVDGLVTDEPGVALTIFSADCTPVLLFDPIARAIGAAHAGWRGTAAGIAARAVEAMQREFGCRPENIRAAVGPCIGPCCFETDADVPDAMRAALGSEAGQAIRPAGAKFYVDLKRLNAIWLRRAGVTCIDVSADCTACQPQRFWSHRRVGNARGSLAAIIRLREADMKRLLALCLLLALLLCACSAAGQPTQATEQPTEETAAAPTETAGAPKTFGLSYLPEHGFNPYTCTATVNRAAFSLLYESLFVVSSHFRAEPLLCESFTASEDGKTYRYTLVSGVSFSDGTPLTAQDAAASLRAAQQSALYSGRLAHMLSVTADDDRTLTVTLDTAYENFSLMLDVPIVSAATVQSSTPLGTGPYYLDGEVLRRSSRWWQTQAPAVTAETIELQAAKTPNDIRDNFEFGSTDLVYCDPNSPAAVGYRCDYEAWESPTPILHYVGFNLYSGWFTNVALRRAFTYGVDREAMTSAVYNGFAQAATLPCSPASDLYDAQLAAQYAYSATAFQAAIHNAGVPTSETDCPVLLVCSDDPARVRAAEYLSSSMQENGFFLKVRSLGREAYVAALQAGNYDAYLGEVRLTANFDLSEFFRTGGALSYGAVADASLAGLCTQALGNSGSYADLCARLLDTVPFCPIVFKSYEVCVSRGAIASISPGVDCVFHNAATARTLADADHSYDGAAEPSTPTDVSADPAEPTEPTDAADPTQEP